MGSTVVDHLSPAQRDAAVRLAERSDADFDDHLMLDLVHGPATGFRAALHFSGPDLDGYAQLSTVNDGAALGVAGDEAARADVATALVTADERRITWWPHANDRSTARRLGFVPGRELLEMSIDLPADSTAVTTREFRPGADDDEWLRVNNRAFAWHDEQGGWTIDTLHQRMQEPWFDPGGFLIHERDGRLAAFCWTKQHLGSAPPTGEIYVIAVDPDFHGLGLGRALTLAGLDSLHRHGMRRAMLFVDADNSSAVGLYLSMGFVVTRSRTAYHRPPLEDTNDR